MRPQPNDVTRFGEWPIVTDKAIAREEWRRSCSEYEEDLAFIHACLECLIFLVVSVLVTLYVIL